MSPQAEELITRVIDEVHKKSVNEARLDGKQEGLKEGKEEIARNLKDVFDDEEISKRTGISLERVKQL